MAAQRAFNVYRGDKMNHTPVAFLRAAPGKPWLRIDGFATRFESGAEIPPPVSILLGLYFNKTISDGDLGRAERVLRGEAPM
ncbi:hypothetical protein AB4Y36_40565, partial [Paraburkholderia sp. BR10936]